MKNILSEKIDILEVRKIMSDWVVSKVKRNKNNTTAVELLKFKREYDAVLIGRTLAYILELDFSLVD